jgi:hypothetical protein
MTYLGWILILWPFLALTTVTMVIQNGWRFAVCFWTVFIAMVASLWFGMKMLTN